MSINLCIDWGNTHIKAAVFEDNKLQKQFTFSEDVALERVADIISTHNPDKAIFCSVTKHNDELIHFIQSKVKSFMKLDSYTRLPINNAYLSPETLGADRLALVAAAHAQFPDKNNLVISLGTCATYNLVQKTRTFRGGAISPGLHMRLRAMHEQTQLLPEVSHDGDLLLLGYDTETGMRSGAVMGMAAEIDGIIAAYREQYPDFNVILTGGDGPFFATLVKSQIFADPDLLVKGLNLILNYNVSSLR